MKNPELNDSISDYSPADRAIIRAALNNARLANKKGAAAKPAAKKAAAPKPTDSRFTGKSSGMGSAAKPKSGAGSMSYTPGSAKSAKSSYTPGSGVSYKAAPTPAKKPRFGGFSILADSLTKKNPKAPKAVTGRRTSGSK